MKKPKLCKGCGKEFTPFTSLQKTHQNYKCYTKWQKSIQKTKVTKMKELVKDYKKLAWTQTSRYVRYTSSVKDKDGKVKCYTCPKVMRPEEADCGHFKHNKLDDDLRNLKIQCTYCNQHLSGNLSEYRKNLIRDYGNRWLDQLEKDAAECEPKKQWQWKEVYLKYKELNKED